MIINWYYCYFILHDVYLFWFNLASYRKIFRDLQRPNLVWDLFFLPIFKKSSISKCCSYSSRWLKRFALKLKWKFQDFLILVLVCFSDELSFKRCQYFDGEKADLDDYEMTKTHSYGCVAHYNDKIIGKYLDQ